MSEHDPIATLLKATGRRPSVPADRMERIRAAATASWRGGVARRARLRRIGWLSSMAAAAVVVIGLVLAVRSLRPATSWALTGVRVDRVVNATSARHGSLPIFRTEVALVAGSMIPTGFDVTTASGARLALRAPTGHSLRLDFGTTVRVLSDRDFVLKRGAVYVDEDGRNPDRRASIRIDTPLGMVEDRGTQFELRLDEGAVGVRVREGVVAIQTAAGSVDARAGEAVRLDRSGGVHRTALATGGADWAWTETITPMVVIEGWSLREFLDWVARERGVTVRFADDRLAVRAPTIELNGSIAGMTIDQATASVLATCGLAARWEGDSLYVTTDKTQKVP